MTQSKLKLWSARYLTLGLFSAILLLFIVPSSHAKQNIDFANLQPEAHLNDLTIDFMTWYQHAYYRVKLSKDFIGLDTLGKPISKLELLTLLSTGDYIALRLQNPSLRPIYQLAAYKGNIDSIRNTIRRMAEIEINFLKMEGQTFPQQSLIALDGKPFGATDSHGKVLWIKTWFIKCVACIKEFPAANQLVKEFAHRKDIQFISLARDNAPDLLKFLAANPLSFSVIPSMEDLIEKKLNLNSYPIHVLVNKAGKIVKITNHLDDMRDYFLRELEQP